MKSLFLMQFLLVLNMVLPTNFMGIVEAPVPDKIVVYKSIDTTHLSLHVFNPEGHKATDNIPVIVFFFGGGWAGGKPKQFYQQSRYFAQKGMVAMAAEYRVKSKHKTTPFDAVRDAKSAIRWVRQHAKELGINPNKIVAAGGSAGGHLAACTGLIENDEEVGEDTTISSKPNVMVLYNPVLDTTEKGYGMDKVGEQQKTAISPNHHIKPGVVPTLVFHGTADKTVPFENAQRFNSLMKQAGNDCELVAYEGKGHGFFNSPFFRGKKVAKMVYTDILEKTYTFLVSKLMDVKLMDVKLMDVKLMDVKLMDVMPSKIFSDHMVLQRGMSVPVWGTAHPGQKITVEFAGQQKNTISDENGEWRIQLDPLEAFKTGRDLVISGKNKIIVSDVLVGEVWICSGQSNMAMSLHRIPDIKALLPKAKNIRRFEVERTVSLKEEKEVKGKWSVQSPTSAVAFSFAYFLEKAGDVPVGIIHASWGSSSIEAWMPRDMTEQIDYFKTIMQEFDVDTVTHNRITNILAKQKNRTKKEDIFLRRQPNILYNAMIKPLAPFALRGFVWYQGERNTRYLSGMPEWSELSKAKWFHRVSGMKEYGATLKAWINRYRKEWKKEDLHFMVVMLPGYGKGIEENPKIDPLDPTAPSWAWMRESQLKALELPHTNVINTIDLGDIQDIHPKDKLPIGQRLALEAAKKTLDQNIVAAGPMLKNVEVRKRCLVVHFNNANELKTADGKRPSSFWIADETLQWKPAIAKIKGKTVVLKSKKIKKPLYIRYAFSGKPDVNLVNDAGLPAYPFRTDKIDN